MHNNEAFQMKTNQTSVYHCLRLVTRGSLNDPWSMYLLNMSSSTEQSPGAETDAFCRSSSATKCISGKSLTLSSEPLVTGVIVLMEQYTTWSEEAVPGHTYSFISCANMHCLSVSSFSSRPFYLCILVGGGTGCYSWWS